MTIDRTGDGSATFRAPRGPAQQDVFQLANPGRLERLDPGLGGARWEWLENWKGPQGRIQAWRLTIYDSRAGLNRTRGYFLDSHAKAKDSTLDTRFREQLTLPLLSASQSSPAPTLTSQNIARRVVHANFRGRLAIATTEDNSATDRLYAETSATDPTLVALSYDAGSPILGLTEIVIAESNYLAVMNAGPIQLLSNLNATPTLAATMHIGTSFAYGIIQCPDFDRTILIYSGGSSFSTSVNGGIYSLKGTDATSTSPTDQYTGLNAGGYALGLLGLGGGPLRAWWVMPRRPYVGLALGLYATDVIGEPFAQGDVVSTNLRGQDPRNLVLPLKHATLAAIWRDGIVASDFERIFFDGGDVRRDLRIFEDRQPNSDRLLRVRGLWVRGDELFAEVNEIASPSGSGASKRWIEHFDYDFNAWHKVSAEETLSTTGVRSIGGAGSLPVSNQTGYLYALSDGVFKRQFQPPAGVNPYSLRQTDGAGASTGAEFETEGTWTSPSWILPSPIDFAPKVIDRIIFGGEAPDGSGVTVTAGGLSHTFNGGLNQRSRVYENSRNNSRFYPLEVTVSLSRSAENTRTTPQAWPVIIEGRAFLDERKAGTWLS